MRKIVVTEYDPIWAQQFEDIRDEVWSVVSDFVHTIEHVGSTSVPGLAAKPIIDIDVVVDVANVMLAAERLSTLGYVHRGNLGIEGREAFSRPPESDVAHHLYVCEANSVALRNHLIVRDTLRSDPTLAMAYGDLKRTLADQFPNDIDRYIDGKTDFLVDLLSRNGLPRAELPNIAAVNRNQNDD